MLYPVRRNATDAGADGGQTLAANLGSGGTPRVFDGRGFCASTHRSRPSQILRDVPHVARGLRSVSGAQLLAQAGYFGFCGPPGFGFDLKFFLGGQQPLARVQAIEHQLPAFGAQA